MKQSLTYKVTAVFLSVLVLFSSLSFSIEKHFCEGEMQSSFFDNAADLCDMQAHECNSVEVAEPCCNSSIEKTDCCIDTSEFIEGISIEQRAQIEQNLSLHPIIFLISDFFTTNTGTEKEIISFYFLLKPILKSIDIGLLFQVFRI